MLLLKQDVYNHFRLPLNKFMIPTSLNSIVHKINTNKKFEIKEQSVLLHFPYSNFHL